MRIEIVEVPTSLGLTPAPGSSRPRGTWRAPRALQAAGLSERLNARRGPAVAVAPYEARPEDDTGARNTAAVRRQTLDVAKRVTRVLEAGDRPLVLGGDCSVLLGPALALRRRGRHGLVFIDGHLDYRHPGNSPRLSAVAGEELAIVTGRGLDALRDIDRLRPYVRDSDVVALGEREHDAATADIRDSEIEVVRLDALRARGVSATGSAAAVRLRGIGYWIHVDVDVLDSALLPAVDSPQQGGLCAAELVELLRSLTGPPEFLGLDVTVYDPELDPTAAGAALLVDILADGICQ